MLRNIECAVVLGYREDPTLQVFTAAGRICEWRRGRAGLTAEEPEPEAAIPLPGLVRRLREIRKSVPRWSDRGGRQGYPKFASPHLP